ncbi:phosphate transporter [Dinochytrium kinnereticum]|nr:phosphate transporter [Dinochytrium kinnereticum]
MQGFGILFGSIIAIICLTAFRDMIEYDVAYLDYVWRICLGFSVIPAIFTIGARMSMPETPQYAQNVQGGILLKDLSEPKQREADTEPLITQQNIGDSVEVSAPEAKRSLEPSGSTSTLFNPASDNQARASFWMHFRAWKNLKVLLGCSIAWFALDVGFYGVQLNQSVVLKAIGFAFAMKDMLTGNRFSNVATPFTDLWSQAVGNLVIACVGTVPGYWVTVFTVEKLGRTRIQIGGFIILAVTLTILAIGFNTMPRIAFMIIYTISQFFFNFGPNTTSFILPGEVFPTRFRTTCHGISAAGGKAGAMVAAYLFGPLKDIGGKDASLPGLFAGFAVFMLIGAGVSFWIPETKGKTLEEISGDGFMAVPLQSVQLKSSSSDGELEEEEEPGDALAGNARMR